MDIQEFQKDQRRKYAVAEERQERRSRRLRMWFYAILIIVAAVELAFVAVRLVYSNPWQ